MLRNNGFHNRHSPFNRAFNPTSLFANGEQGWIYDPSNFATLFQDSAGTTPVTAVEQPVGLQLDLSGNNNHRFQATSANRPVVSARVNLLTKTEQFDNSDWTKFASTVTPNSITAPDSTTTADLIIPSVVNTFHLVSQSIITSFTSSYTLTVYAKAAGYNFLQVLLAQTGGANYVEGIFNLSNGTIEATGRTLNWTGTRTIEDVGNGWYRCSVIVNSIPSGISLSSQFGVLNTNDGNASFAGNGTSGVYLWGADLRLTNQGVNLPVYQRVNTSTDYTSTGFPIYIKPNGSNQFMQTNSINFTATNKMTVWQGTRKLSDAATAVFSELGNITSDSGVFNLFNLNTVGSYGFASKGSVIVSAATTSYAAPTTNVLTGIGDISGDVCTLRVNGTQAATTTTDQGTGNYGNLPTYFYSRAGSSLYFSGNDYASIARGAASTTTQITDAETWVNNLTKAY